MKSNVLRSKPHKDSIVLFRSAKRWLSEVCKRLLCSYKCYGQDMITGIIESLQGN